MVKLEPPIALGRTAEVYAWEDGQVIKLFRDGMSIGSLEHEANIARTVEASGLRVPRFRGIAAVNGRRGLVFERIVGAPLLATIRTRPWRVPEAARLLAELHAAIHSRQVDSLRSLQAYLASKIKAAHSAPPASRALALVMLKELPAGGRLCHGDFHPENIILTEAGPVIIDWADAAQGPPLADVARTSLLLKTAALPPGPQGRLIGLLRAWFHQVYLKRYFEINPANPLEFQIWLGVNAAARLGEGTFPEQDHLLKILSNAFKGEQVS